MPEWNEQAKATKFVGDGTELTVKTEKGEKSLKEALENKFDKAGGKIDGPVSIVGKVSSGNVRKESSAENEISTSKNNYADMPGMTINVNTGDSSLYILAVVSEAWASENSWSWYRLLVDGKQVGVTRNHFVSRHSSVVIHRLWPVTAGSHAIKVQWKAGATAKSHSTRTLTVIEM